MEKLVQLYIISGENAEGCVNPLAAFDNKSQAEAYALRQLFTTKGVSITPLVLNSKWKDGAEDYVASTSCLLGNLIYPDFIPDID